MHAEYCRLTVSSMTGDRGLDPLLLWEMLREDSREGCTILVAAVLRPVGVEDGLGASPTSRPYKMKGHTCVITLRHTFLLARVSIFFRTEVGDLSLDLPLVLFKQEVGRVTPDLRASTTIACSD
jgi:hypothetical protein